MEDIAVIKRAYERERRARKKAEAILEKKSYELYLANQALASNNSTLAEKVEEQTAKLQRIVDFISILLPQITLDEIADSLAEVATNSLNLSHCGILFWDEGEGKFSSRSKTLPPMSGRSGSQAHADQTSGGIPGRIDSFVWHLSTLYR